MRTILSSFILLILLADIPATTRLSIAPPPRPPMNTVGTGLVVLNMYIDSSGKPSRLETVQGMAPFVEPSLEAVRQWTFEPLKKDQPAVAAAAIFLFRARTVLPDSAFSLELPPEPASAADSPPRPVTITDPGYPVQSAAEGVVVLQLQIDSSGRIQKTDVIQDVPSLTWAATHGVSQWKFAPAMHRGKAVPGIAIAAISFLRPVLSH